MIAGVCLKCAEAFEGGVQSCPRCGKRLARSARGLVDWERARQRKRIDTWLAGGVIDEATAKKLRSHLADPPAPGAEAEATPAADQGESAVERRADGVVAGTAAFFGEMSARWTKITRAIDEDAPPSSGSPRSGGPLRDDAHLEASRAIFAREDGGNDSAVVGAGVEALAGLDHEDPASGHENREAGKPFGALQVFWFIGVLLILAGSVMGVREAWRTLAGVWRPIVIAGALFAYHVLFVALARLLARRSAVTGRILAVIAAGLLPIVFVAAAVAIGQRASAGGPFAAVLLAASSVTLVALGRTAFDRGSGAALAVGLVPALVLELAIGSGGVAPLRRIVFAVVALVPLALVSMRARRTVTSSLFIALGAAAYGALATFVLALYGGPGDPVLTVDSDPLGARALLVWLAWAASIAWWATSGPSMTARFPRLGAVPSILALAVLVSTSVAAFAMSWSSAALTLGDVRHAPLVVLILATAVLTIEQRARRGALHVAIMLAMATSLVLARTIEPLRQDLWAPMCAVVPACLLVLVGLAGDQPRRVILSWWGVGLGAVTLTVELVTEGSTGGDLRPWIYSAATAGMLALAAHAGARAVRPILHHAGAAFAFTGACAYFLPSRVEPWIHTFMFVCAGLTVVYGALALPYDVVAKKDDDRRPLDDASLVIASLGTWFGVAFADVASAVAVTADTRRAAAWIATPAVALAVVLLARSLRDRSALVVWQASIALALAVHIGMGVRTVEGGVFFAGILALAFLVPAAFRAPRSEGEPRFGRPLFGFVPLPLGGVGRTLLDGFGLGALLLAILASMRGIGWMGGMLPESDRPLVVLGLASVIAAAVFAFLTRGLDVLAARGSVATLSLAGLAIALAAVANRIGRPLPPEVVGFRISLILAGVWVVARAFVKWGPRLGEALDRPKHGPHYHFVPHAGVLALVLLLLADAYFIGSPTWTRALVVTPPLFFAGASLGLLLLVRSFGREILLHVALFSALAASAFGFAQRAIRGPSLVPLVPPGGRWVPTARVDMASIDWLDPSRFLSPGDTEALLWDRAWLGLSVAALGLALVLAASTRIPAVERGLSALLFPAANAGPGSAEAVSGAPEPAIARSLDVSILAAAVLLGLGLAWQPRVPSAAAFVGAGVLAALAMSPSYRAITLAIAAPVLLHALAHRGVIVPDWGGPAIAALGLAWVLVGRLVSDKRGRDVSVLAATQIIAVAYAPIALVYAFAARGATTPLAAAPGLVALASATWIVSYAPAVTFAILAITVAVSAFAWKGGLASVVAAGSPLVLGIASIWFATAFAATRNGSDPDVLVTREGALLGASLALAALLSHVSAYTAARVRREDTSSGFAVGRDVVLGATTLVMALYVGYRRPGGLFVGPSGSLALGVAIAVSLHAAMWRGAGRHVLLVETLIVAFYAFATRRLALPPEIDALAGLLYGFSLVGVAVIARRRGITPVADATRRFAAILPIALLLLTTTGPTAQAAGLALGSSVLYGTMAYVDKSRIFGTFAAAFANLALVVFALAQGLDGIEIFVGPLGILVTALSQIFASKLRSAARDTLRILGGALLYLPAGLKLTLRLGEAADGTYSVVFGAVCLLGVVVGLALRVRAYLALGTLFLTLDVIANLVYAGLRDHRIGFVLLSASGLLILGTMIAITIRRDAALALVRRLRARLRGWD